MLGREREREVLDRLLDGVRAGRGGVLVMHGPGIRQDERIYGAGLLDIAPTILHLFGLPVGRDMDGKVLLTAMESPAPIERIESWEDVQGDSGMDPPDAALVSITASADV